MTEFTQVLFLLAYAAALYYWLRVRSDYPQGSTMRRALGFLCVSCVLSLLRHATELAIQKFQWGTDSFATSRSLRQIPIALALLFLIVALAAMWRSFRSVGLGVSIRGIDVFWAILIIALVPPVLFHSGDLTDARSGLTVIRVIQWFSPILLAVPALLAVFLHRVSREMEGGFFAVSLRLLVASLILRLCALVVYLWPGLEARTAGTLTSAVPLVAAILFALSAWNRWRMTIHAGKLYMVALTRIELVFKP